MRQLSPSELFLSAQGRAPRLPSVIVAIALLALAALYEDLVGSALHWLTGWIVYPALRNGTYYPWDHQPLQKASERYMRNHMDLNVLEESKRFPRGE